MWSKQSVYSIIFQGAKTGKDNGYTMLFDIESFDYSYYDEGSEGLKVALVHHLDMPIMRQTGFHIAPGTENQVRQWHDFRCLSSRLSKSNQKLHNQLWNIMYILYI